MFVRQFSRFVRTFSTHVHQPTIVPFKIKHREAINKLNIKRFFEPDYVEPSKKNVTECFLPIYAFDLTNLKVSYDGRVGTKESERVTKRYYDHNTKTWEEKDEWETVIKWRQNVNGVSNCKHYPMYQKEMQFYAGFRYPRDKIEAIIGGDWIEKNVSMDDKLLKEKSVEPLEMKVSYPETEIIGRLDRFERRRVEDLLLKKYSGDVVEFYDFKVHLDLCDKIIHPIYIPVYVHVYQHQNDTFYKFVNGYNGWTCSENTYATGKMLAVFTTIGAIAPWLATLFLGPVGKAVLLTRVLIGVATANIPVLWARFWPHYRKRRDLKKLANEREVNKKITSIDADEELDKIMKLLSDKDFLMPVIEEKKETKSEFKNEKKETEKEVKSYDKTSCQIIGLDSQKSISLETLENAYQKQKQEIQQDKSDNKLARQKSEKLYEAYEKLKSEITSS